MQPATCGARGRARSGATALEMMIVLGTIGILLGVAIPRIGALRDRAAVRAATAEVVESLALARHTAIRQGRIVAVRFDPVRARITVFASSDTFSRRHLRLEHGVSLAASRDSIAFAPNGRGHGASNTTIRLTRGAAADTVVVARLGRVRW